MRGVWVLAFAGLLAGCVFEDSERLRYRMTVEVEASAGVRSGSSVIESTITKGPGFGDASGISSGLRGEAVAVDLPGGRSLFALLRSKDDRDTAGYHARLVQGAACGKGEPSARPDPAFCEPDSWREFRRWAKSTGLKVTLAPDDYPLLVTFRDISDPKSVVRVDPGDLAATFGPGTRLRAVTVAVTDKPVTIKIEKRLGWLQAHRGTLKPDPPAFLSDPSDPNLRLLGTGPFWTELHR